MVLVTEVAKCGIRGAPTFAAVDILGAVTKRARGEGMHSIDTLEARRGIKCPYSGRTNRSYVLDDAQEQDLLL